MTSARPRKIGSFEVRERIGQGGMGTVYLAWQPALERAVVLKEMRRELDSEPEAVERFEREARAAASISHQNVVAVLDCFESRGRHYIAQEYVDGADLQDTLARAGRLAPRIVGLVGLAILRGLEEVHARGIVHRDLKPSNILVARTGETKLADFGIALDEKAAGLTRPGAALGSLPYMAPEQLLGQRADARSDLFSLGAILYELLAGRPPFQAPKDGDDDGSWLERVQRGDYPKLRSLAPQTPRALERIIRLCLRADRRRRATSATALRRELERQLRSSSPADARREIAEHLHLLGVFESRDGETRVHTAAVAATPRRSRRWLFAAAAAAVILAGASWLYQVRGPSPAEPGPRVDASVVEAPAAVPARLRVAATPWARIRIDGGAEILTPRAEPVLLPAGRHTVAFEHPSLGRHEEIVDLSAGESRHLVHRFDAKEVAP